MLFERSTKGDPDASPAVCRPSGAGRDSSSAERPLQSPLSSGLRVEVTPSPEERKGVTGELDPRWIGYYAEASKRRRARGWHRRRRDPPRATLWSKRKLILILCAAGVVAAVMAALVP